MIIVFSFDNPFKNVIEAFCSPSEAPLHYCCCDLFSKIKYLSQNCVTFQFQPEENTAIWAQTSGNALLRRQCTELKWQLACCHTCMKQRKGCFF